MPFYSKLTEPVIEPVRDRLASDLPTSRREFLGGAALAAVGLSIPMSAFSDAGETPSSGKTPGFHDLRRTMASGMALSRMKLICRSKISSGSLSNPTMKPAMISIP